MPPAVRAPLVARLSAGIGRYLIWLLLVAYAAAAFGPQAGLAIREETIHGVPLPFLLLAMLLFCAGLGIDGHQLRVALRARWLVLAGQGVFWVVPLAAAGLLKQLPVAWPPGLLAGLGLIALMPAAASSVAWSQLGGGNVAVSVGLLVSSTLICPFLISGLFILDDSVGGFATRSFTAVTLLVWMLPVVSAGVAARACLGPCRMKAIRPYAAIASTVALLLLNYANAALALPSLLSGVAGTTIVAVAITTAAICCSGFLAGGLVARNARASVEARDSLVYGFGMKNTGVALVLAGCWFETLPLATLSIIVYTLTQHVLAAAYHAHRVLVR